MSASISGYKLLSQQPNCIFVVRVIHGCFNEYCSNFGLQYKIKVREGQLASKCKLGEVCLIETLSKWIENLKWVKAQLRLSVLLRWAKFGIARQSAKIKLIITLHNILNWTRKRMDYSRGNQLKKDRLCFDFFCSWRYVDNSINGAWTTDRILCGNALRSLLKRQDVYWEKM